MVLDLAARTRCSRPGRSVVRIGCARTTSLAGQPNQSTRLVAMTKSLSQSLARYWLLPSLIVAWLSLSGAASPQSAAHARVNTSFDSDWRFLKGDAPGAEKADFDDATWRRLNVPHDWSIEGPFDEKNSTGGAGGFLPAGVGWYRKRFS